MAEVFLKHDISWKDCMFQTLSIPSIPTEASLLESPLKLTEFTPPLCAFLISLIS